MPEPAPPPIPVELLELITAVCIYIYPEIRLYITYTPTATRYRNCQLGMDDCCVVDCCFSRAQTSRTQSSSPMIFLFFHVVITQPSQVSITLTILVTCTLVDGAPCAMWRGARVPVWAGGLPAAAAAGAIMLHADARLIQMQIYMVGKSSRHASCVTDMRQTWSCHRGAWSTACIA